MDTKTFYKYFFWSGFLQSRVDLFCNYLEIYTKTVSRLRFGDYKLYIHFAFGSVNIGLQSPRLRRVTVK